MRYGIDLDGVLVDMHIGFARVVNLLYPGRIARGHEHPTDWDLTSLGLTNGEVGRVWARIRHIPNWWYSLPAIYANVSAVYRHRIRHPNDEIFYVTARSTETDGLPIMHQSQQWLDACGIGGTGTAVIVAPPDVHKISIYKRIGVVKAIDDSSDVVKMGPQVIRLLAQPWNKNAREGLNVVETMEEFFNGYAI